MSDETWLCTKCGSTKRSDRKIGDHYVCGGCGKYLMKRVEPAPCPAEPTIVDRSRVELQRDFDKACMEIDALRARVAALESALTLAVTGLARAKDALNRDRTGLAAALEKIGSSRGEVSGRWWLRPLEDGGSWASYAYEEQTEATLRQEFAWALDAIGKIATGALQASGNLAVVEVRAADDAERAARAALADPEDAP